MEGYDEDEFWRVALENEEETSRGFIEDSISVDDSNADVEGMDRNRRIITYNMPWKPIKDEDAKLVVIPLKLSPLPDADGIWSPLGAQAWHASSLLAAYLLQNTILKLKSNQSERKPSLLSKHIESWFAANNHETAAAFTALELGSGAVGLVGIVMGLILADCSSSGTPQNPQLGLAPRIILTDNEPKVLKNLQQNVDKTLAWLENEEVVSLSLLPDIRAQHLDWDKYQKSDLREEGHSLQLVFGTELVYTHETAQACANIVLELLQANPNVLVCILQVTDRDGWTNVFLPTIRQYSHLQITEEPMQNSELHQLAETITPPGGTLDRFAFGGCYIFHRSGSVATLLDP